jgi:hypothetical protein
MTCPYLASYRSTERGQAPTEPSGANVCYASGSAYWPYSPVQLGVQRSLCLKDKDHRSCPAYRKAVERGAALPQGMQPAVAVAVPARNWWHFWG